MEVLFTTKVPFFGCNHLAKYNYSVFCKRRLVSIVNKQWTHPWGGYDVNIDNF